MRYFIIVGEASGDLHASNLMCELNKVDPLAEFCFLGGDLMLAQGGTLVKHYREMAFMGFVAVLKNAKTILENIRVCKAAVTNFNPDVVILVDYPGFNLRMAKFVKTNLHLPVYYYISPKIWAWKEYRIKNIKLYVDKMLTIFPFETEFYKKHNYKVDYVGNPTVDSIANRPNQKQTFNEFCSHNNLPLKPVIALLAGSRKQEIEACLPRMLNAALHFSDYQIVISGAPGIDSDFYNQFTILYQIPVVVNQTYELIQQADIAIVNSGTATLETALIGTPQVVVYHVQLGRLAILAKNLFIKVKYISLVNLIAGKEVVKELYAHLFTVERLVNEMNEILNNENCRQQILKDYGKINTVLGKPGAAERCAENIFSSLKK